MSRKTNPLILMTRLTRSGKQLHRQLVDIGFHAKSISPQSLFESFLELSPDLLLVELTRDFRSLEDVAHRIRGTDQGMVAALYFYGEGEGPNPAEVVSMGGDLYFKVPVDGDFLVDKLGFMLSGDSTKLKGETRETGDNGAIENAEPVGNEPQGDAVLKALEMAEQLSVSGFKEREEAPQRRASKNQRQRGPLETSVDTDLLSREEPWAPKDKPYTSTDIGVDRDSYTHPEINEEREDDDLLSEISQEMGFSESEQDLPPDLELKEDAFDEEISRAMAKKLPTSDTLWEDLESEKMAPQTDILSSFRPPLPKVPLDEKELLEEASPKAPGTDPVVPLFSEEDGCSKEEKWRGEDGQGSGNTSDTSEMDILEELEGGSEDSFSEPGIPDVEGGSGVVPSLKAMLPDDIGMGGRTAELDLDMLDVESTVSGVESTGLKNLADPAAGTIGLDAPAVEPDQTGEPWSAEKEDGREDSQTDDRYSPSRRKPGKEGDVAGKHVHQIDPLAPGADTLAPEPGVGRYGGHDAKVALGRRGRTEVLDTNSPTDDRNTVVGHKKGGEFYSPSVEGAKELADSPIPETNTPVAKIAPKKKVSASFEMGTPEPLATLEGRLEEEDPVEIVRGVFRAVFSGWLEVSGKEGRVAFYFDRGKPKIAQTSTPSLDLASRLQRQARISRGQLEEVREEMDSGQGDVGEVLLRRGYVDATELEFLRKAHMEALFYEVMGWTEGSFLLSQRPGPSRSSVVLDPSLSALLLEALRRKEKGRDIMYRMGGEDTRLVDWKLEWLAFLTEMGDLTGREKRVLEKLTGGMSLRDVADAAKANINMVANIAYVAHLLHVASLSSSDHHLDSQESSFSPVHVNLRAHEERIESKLEEVAVGDYFTLLGLPLRASVYEIEKAHANMMRNFSETILPASLCRQRLDDLKTIRSALDEALSVLTHPQYGRLYRRALEIESEKAE